MSNLNDIVLIKEHVNPFVKKEHKKHEYQFVK